MVAANRRKVSLTNSPWSGCSEQTLVLSRTNGALPLPWEVIFVTLSGRVNDKNSGTARLISVDLILSLCYKRQDLFIITANFQEEILLC